MHVGGDGAQIRGMDGSVSAGDTRTFADQPVNLDTAMDPTDLPSPGLLHADPAPMPSHTEGHSLDQVVMQRTQADLMRFQELLAQVGRELAEPLTAALERVDALVGTGRIDRQGMKALLKEVSHARQAGIWCQQISRLATGRVHQSHERVHLTQVLQGIVAHRAREFQARGVVLHQTLLAVEVQADASMLFAMLNTAFDWGLACAQGPIELALEVLAWPGHAQLRMRVVTSSAELVQLDGGEIEPPAALNAMSWHLTDQYARAMGVSLQRVVMPMHVDLLMEFPHTVVGRPVLDEVRSDADQGFSSTLNSRPLAGSHVLVVAGRRDLRLLIRESLKSMGLVVDFVSTMTEAAQFCREALPHALIFESNLRGLRLEQLLVSIRQEAPDFVVVEVQEEGHAFEISESSPTGMARVGREALLQSLPAALVQEMSRGL